MQVDTWLKSQGLGKYRDAIRKLDIKEFHLLMDLTAAESREVAEASGMSPKSTKRFIQAIEACQTDLQALLKTHQLHQYFKPLSVLGYSSFSDLFRLPPEKVTQLLEQAGASIGHRIRLQRLFGTAKKRAAGRNQLWIPSENVVQCMRCRTAFGYLVRKHYCRCCGVVVCRRCSPHFVFLNDNPLPVRVCLDCETRTEFVSTQVIKKGFLTKLGSSVRNWRKRFFVLTSTQILYYKKEFDEKELGSINLSLGFSIVKETQPSFSFSIILSGTHGRKFVLSAKSEEDREDWIQAVKVVQESQLKEQRLSAARGGNLSLTSEDLPQQLSRNPATTAPRQNPDSSAVSTQIKLASSSLPSSSPSFHAAVSSSSPSSSSPSVRTMVPALLRSSSLPVPATVVTTPSGALLADEAYPHPKDVANFEAMILSNSGFQAFAGYLRGEHSEEHLEFWQVVNEFKSRILGRDVCAKDGPVVNPVQQAKRLRMMDRMMKKQREWQRKQQRKRSSERGKTQMKPSKTGDRKKEKRKKKKKKLRRIPERDEEMEPRQREGEIGSATPPELPPKRKTKKPWKADSKAHGTASTASSPALQTLKRSKSSNLGQKSKTKESQKKKKMKEKKKMKQTKKQKRPLTSEEESSGSTAGEEDALHFSASDHDSSPSEGFSDSSSSDSDFAPLGGAPHPEQEHKISLEVQHVEAKRIFETYLAPGSPKQVNVPHSYVQAVQAVLERPIPSLMASADRKRRDGSSADEEAGGDDGDSSSDSESDLPSYEEENSDSEEELLELMGLHPDTYLHLFDQTQFEVWSLLERDSFHRFQTKSGYEEWVLAVVQSFVNNVKAKILAERKRQAEEEGGSIWLPDDSTQCCMLCGTAWTFILRRHHCRNCGKLVCRRCSPHFRLMRKHNPKVPQRICVECEGNPEVLDDYIRKTGHLVKLGHNVKNWKRRFFVLCDDQLAYLKNEHDDRLQGRLSLANGASVVLEEEPRHCFSVIVSGMHGRKYVIVAENEEDRISWVEALRQVLEPFNPQ